MLTKAGERNSVQINELLILTVNTVKINTQRIVQRSTVL